ncbi:DUF6215 domain-containing protein [Streptomyces sp. NPDC054884]|uniref:DUF6215 domain-containing protein n=1 Tax=Streptomyces sp. ME08-AFT2 TaxID=3028683 RepID=UPI0029B5BA4A|nr:DUF6215 domain-containing protein [Streptomyces sp. ME08-AFT2]MDX3311163.1 DUF6215 domain-containing protein [Streptomyces sp. ME08-AFT2]
MTEEVAAAEKGPNAWAQAIAALVVVGALGGALYVIQQNDAKAAAEAADKPATCRVDDEDEKADQAAKAAKRVSGTQLCTALNRTDLPTLLGTPTEHARTAYGSDGSVETGGKKIPSPEGTVQLDTYTVKLSRSYDDFPIAGMQDLLNEAQTKTVAGHPAVLYSSPTIAIRFDLGGGKSQSAPGGIARTLVVAPDVKDNGGSYELSIWRQDNARPDDTALLRIAQQVLPTIPGWTTAR